MADEKPISPQEDSKRDTVRINLPPSGPGGAGARGGPSTVRMKTTSVGVPIQILEEKEATAIIGRPVPTSKPRSDTSQVEVSGAVPATTERPRPTVKLHREDLPAATAPAAASASAKAPAVASATVAAASSGSGMETSLALAAMVLSLVVAAYLAYAAFV